VQDWPNGQVVLEAADGVEYEELLPEVGHIHIALVDLMMPRRDGYQTMRWMGRHQPRTRALAFSVDPHHQHVTQALQCGARGFVYKGQSRAEWHRALEDVVTRDFHFNQYVSRALVKQLRETTADRRPDALWDRLTEREREFLLLYATHLSEGIEAIARRMGVKRSTAETYRAAVAEKLGVPSRAELVALVKENRWDKPQW